MPDNKQPSWGHLENRYGEPRPRKLLALDGGGIRGVSPGSGDDLVATVKRFRRKLVDPRLGRALALQRHGFYRAGRHAWADGTRGKADQRRKRFVAERGGRGGLGPVRCHARLAENHRAIAAIPIAGGICGRSHRPAMA